MRNPRLPNPAIADADTDSDRDEPSCAAATKPPASVEPLLGGTLALLSHYARTPSIAAADKIACNFACIARHPAVSPAMRAVCTKLFLQWVGPVQTQDESPERHWRDVWPQPPAMQ